MLGPDVLVALVCFAGLYDGGGTRKTRRDRFLSGSRRRAGATGAAGAAGALRLSVATSLNLLHQYWHLRGLFKALNVCLKVGFEAKSSKKKTKARRGIGTGSPSGSKWCVKPGPADHSWVETSYLQPILAAFPQSQLDSSASCSGWLLLSSRHLTIWNASPTFSSLRAHSAKSWAEFEKKTKANNGFLRALTPKEDGKTASCMSDFGEGLHPLAGFHRPVQLQPPRAHPPLSPPGLHPLSQLMGGSALQRSSRKAPK